MPVWVVIFLRSVGLSLLYSSSICLSGLHVLFVNVAGTVFCRFASPVAT
jgi:hypothetical protein